MKTIKQLRDEVKPILKKKRDGLVSWQLDIDKVKANPEVLQDPSFTKLDRIWAGPIGSGIRRATQTGLHLVGWTLTGTALALKSGMPLQTALVYGAAAALGPTMLTLGAAKASKENATNKGLAGKGPIDWILWGLYNLLNALIYYRNKSKKEDD